jgi:hypothetical protein
MLKAKWLKIVNPLLALSFLTQAGSGIFKHSLPHDAFEVVHEGGGWVLIALAAAHVVLNWSWIRAQMLSGSRKTAA